MTIAASNAVRPSTGSQRASGLAINGGTPVSAKPVAFMSTALTEADIAAVYGVLKSGMLRASGKCAELERRWSEATGAKHSLTCSNGTTALQLAYEPLFAPGDEVLVPAWSYIATVSMVVARGGVPVFVEANPATYQIDVADAARKVTSRTRAITPTHLYGCPVDVAGVQALASKHGLKVIYDAAQAHLATYDGKGLGVYGDAVTYSMYATKNLATGEGGIITCNDDSLARTIGLLRSHGETEKYLHEVVGYNYRLNDMAGALGCSRLDRLAAQTQRRREVAAEYDRGLAGIGGISVPVTTPNAVPVYHLYVAQMDPAQFGCTRDELCNALKAEGIPTAVHYPRSLPQQPALARYAKAGDTPIANGLKDRVFALPIHHDLSAEDIKAVCAAVVKVAEAFAR